MMLKGEAMAENGLILLGFAVANKYGSGRRNEIETHPPSPR